MTTNWIAAATTTGNAPSSVSATGDPGSNTWGVPHADISGFPFEFNPPLHNANFHIRPELSGSEEQAMVEADKIYRQRYYVKGMSLRGFTNLRQGRITMTDRAENFPPSDKIRWGFRFLYNPPSIGGAQVFRPDILPDFKSEVPLLLQVGLETLVIPLLLDRVPDLSPNTDTINYVPQIQWDTLEEIKKRGTNLDLEYLFRVTNVQTVQTIDSQDTADFGLLLPNICMLTLGKMRYRGRVQGITTQHVMFSPDMVPIRTMVNIQFQRVVSMELEEFEEFATGGGWDVKSHLEEKHSGSDSGSSSSSSSSSGVVPGDQPAGVPSPHTLSFQSLEQLAKNAGFNASQAKTMAAIGLAESGGNTHAHNDNAKTGDNSYGLWQINMIGAMGAPRREAFGISSNEQLFNPSINARAAKIIYDQQGFNAWSVYRSGAYRKHLP